MPEPRILTIELGRQEQAHVAHAFDGKPQKYFARSAHGLGVADFPWDEVEKLRPEFLHAAPTAKARKHMGDLLRRFLGDVLKDLEGWAFHENALLDAEARQERIRLRFRFHAVELFSLPWALTALRNGQNLGALKPNPLQFEWVNGVSVPRPSLEQDRVLFAWSNAEDDVSEDLHREAIQQACPGFDRTQDELENLSLDSLRDALHGARQAGKPFRLLHILCHGGLVPGGTFGLVWTQPQGTRRPALVDGDSLSNVLGPFKRDLHAVVLSACHGSNPGRVGSTFGGVAHDLNRLGIPVVIASMMPLTIHGSIQMTEAFYAALFQKTLSIEEAFQKAHEALSPSSLDWASLQFLTVSTTPEARAGGRRIVFSPDMPLPALSEELVVSYEVNYTVSSPTILEALAGHAGEQPDTVVLRPLERTEDDLPGAPREWQRALKQADQLVEALGTDVSRVNLFGRAPLPLMFHLGWRLSRCPMRVYQEERGRTGKWSCGYDSLHEPAPEAFFRVEAWPDTEALRVAGGRLVMTLEVQPRIPPEDLAKWLGTDNPPALIRLVAARGPAPSVMRGPMDSARAVEDFRACLDRIQQDWPDVREIWLAMTGPASLAAALGRAYNPKAQATLKLFNHRKTEGYVEVPWNGGVSARPRRRS